MNALRLPASQVQVVLSDGSAADAGTVFEVLEGRFACDRTAEEAPREDESHRPTVWTSTFDLPAPAEAAESAGGTGEGAQASPARLSGPVTAEVQGTHLAVRRLREVLEEAFTVQEAGTDAGDQEIQVQLRLEGSAQGGSRAV
ncbi:hypothetical protein ACFY93_33975 [Streptomyces sp. NPDC008313]|uniref:hypothetical protein n=1 Tax=Streptomyces sp. NPDC008313 TaxID=3364826 RepID=UPI0036E4B846